MKKICPVLILILFVGTVTAQNYSLVHDGLTRTYIVYVPTTYTALKSYPVVFALHGYSGTGSTFLTNGFNERAELLDYIAVYPDGVNNGWNIGSGSPDDVGFLSTLIDTLKERYSIDSKRIYFTGHSNGSYMCYKLAAELPEKTAAVAPVEGLLPSSLMNIISTPVPVIHIHALDDPAVPYDGSYGTPGVDSLMNFWKRVNHCIDRPDTLYHTNDLIGQRWRATETGADVVLYKFRYGGHTWLNAPLFTTDLITDFFFTHPKQKTNVRLTSPLNNHYDVHSTIELSAAVESDNPITKVEYFANMDKIGESVLPPYSFTWNDVPADDYIISAKALIADGTAVRSSNLQLIHVMLPSISLYKPCECSSVKDDSFFPDNASDGDFATRWSSASSDPQWITVDLQGIYRISGVTLYWGPTYAPSYDVEASLDNENWTRVYTTYAGDGNADFISFTPVEVQYVRVFGMTRSTPWGYSLWEYQVQGEFVRATSVSNSAVTKILMDMTVSPNPFNPTTTIQFSLPNSAHVTLRVYNLIGEEVTSLLSQKMTAGKHSIRWNATGIASGIYFCRLQIRQSSGGQVRQTSGGQAGGCSETKKLILLR